MCPLLRGSSSVNTKGGQLKLVRDFVEATKNDVPREDQRKFSEAYEAQINNNIARAKNIYEELLAKYPNNKAIKHNLA